MAKPFELFLGMKTYEIFAAYWPYAKDEPGAEQLNSAKKYVVSRTLSEVDGTRSRYLKGDVVQEIRKLKEQDGPELLVHGSSNLIQTLLKHNLVDEFRLWVFPVVIGNGKRLFDRGTVPSGLNFIASKASGTGVIVAIYAPGGELKTGSLLLDNPSEADLARRE